MNLFEQIKKLRNKQSSSSSTSSSTSSSNHTSDDESSNSIFSHLDSNNDSEDNNNESDTPLSSFWKQGTSDAWGPAQIEYKIQPNKIEKKLGMFQNSLSIAEYEPFKPNVAYKTKRLYELPKVSRIEIEDIMSQRGLFDE